MDGGGRSFVLVRCGDEGTGRDRASDGVALGSLVRLSVVQRGDSPAGPSLSWPRDQLAALRRAVSRHAVLQRDGLRDIRNAVDVLVNQAPLIARYLRLSVWPLASSSTTGWRGR